MPPIEYRRWQGMPVSVSISLKCTSWIRIADRCCSKRVGKSFWANQEIQLKFIKKGSGKLNYFNKRAKYPAYKHLCRGLENCLAALSMAKRSEQVQLWIGVSLPARWRWCVKIPHWSSLIESLWMSNHIDVLHLLQIVYVDEADSTAKALH